MEPIDRTGWNRGLYAVVLVAALAALAAHAWTYLPFVSDDALISLRYARRFMHGAGLTWNDGERVEGYSNLLWVLGCAGLGRMGVDPIDAARTLGVLGMGATVAAAVFAGRRLSAAAVGGFAVAAAAPVAAWTVGGLEQPLVAGLLAWAVVLTYPLLDGPHRRRAMVGPAVLFALLCWTRPDGPLFAFGAAVGVVAARRDRVSLQVAAAFGGAAGLAVLAQLSFRLSFYGEWVPNTALVKLAFSPDRVLDGLTYLGFGCGGLAPLVLLAGVGVAIPQPGRRRVLLLAPILLLWGAYVVAIGGDIFPARRHLVPIVVLLALVAVEVVASVRWSLGWVAAVVFPVALGWASERDPDAGRAHYEHWEWDAEVIGRVLGRSFSTSRPLLAVEAAGSVPYFSGLPCVDLFGLNDAHIAHHRPQHMGRGRLGHELGDATYLMERGPDLILLGRAEGKAELTGPTGFGLARDRTFRQNYQLVSFLGTDPYRFRSKIWVRRDSPKIGIRSGLDQIEIPGLFFSDGDRLSARRGEDRKLGVDILVDEPAFVWGLDLPLGDWIGVADATGSPVVVEILRVPSLTTRVDVQIETDGWAQVRSVTLVRVDEPE